MHRKFGTLVTLLVATACGSEGIPKEYVADRDRMTAAFSAFSQATELTQPPAGETTFEMPQAREDSVIMLIARGIATADSIGDPFLTWLHPDLPRYFRNYYVAGQRQTLEGLRRNDAARQVRGNELVAEWYSAFWDRNQEAIVAKAMP